jgi:SEC-C motif-containing protein
MPSPSKPLLSDATQPCPCGRLDTAKRALALAACCGRYLDHFDTTPAPDAESLMRSRYTAFVRERADYLLATWHPQRRPEHLGFDPGTRWLGLEVKARKTIDADQAEVEFVARQRDASGRAHRLHERSRFVREEGRWYYVDAL